MESNAPLVLIDCFEDVETMTVTISTLLLCATCNDCVDIKGSMPTAKDCAALPKVCCFVFVFVRATPCRLPKLHLFNWVIGWAAQLL